MRNAIISLKLFACFFVFPSMVFGQLDLAWIHGSQQNNQNGTYGPPGMANSGYTPGGRNGAMTWTDASGNLWLFGGQGYAETGTDGYLGDLWKFDVTIGQWAWIKGPKTPNVAGVYGTKKVSSSANYPGARHRAMATKDGNGDLWLFGGYGYSSNATAPEELNDLWFFLLLALKSGRGLADQPPAI